MEAELIPHPYRWFLEPLIEDPTYIERRMFGSLACYLEGKLVLVLSAQNEQPWHGVLVPAEKSEHPAIRAELPDLTPHPILGKWLYIPEDHDNFEICVQKVVARIKVRDRRFGTIPPLKKKRLKKKSKISK